MPVIAEEMYPSSMLFNKGDFYIQGAPYLAALAPVSVGSQA